MGKELKRLKRRKEAWAKMQALQDQAATTLLVHYSSASSHDRSDGRTPRVTSIAVRNLASGQTDAFSIYQIAEERHLPFDLISQHYDDDVEGRMLGRFHEFVRTRQDWNWVHWNMRGVNYGFSAIEQRTRVLERSPVQISEDRKFDLSRALVDLYGVGYIDPPKLETLLTRNEITAEDLMTDKQEADAFEQKNLLKLHQSTLVRVDCLAEIFERTMDGSLKTDSTWMDRHGYGPAAVVEWAKENPGVTFLIAGAGILTSILLVYGLWV